MNQTNDITNTKPLNVIQLKGKMEKPSRAWWERLWKMERYRAWILAPSVAGNPFRPWLRTLAETMSFHCYFITFHWKRTKKVNWNWNWNYKKEKREGFVLRFCSFHSFFVFRTPTEIYSKFALSNISSAFFS